ncbi:MAG: hypothetical protein JEZ07_14785 [Phycisphaerae bacterium]|nr:hypothetical protein [Phycisphaerae bacterium]
MNIKRFRLLLATLSVWVIIFTVGCSSAKIPAKPIITNLDTDTIWQICQSQLRDRGFDINITNKYDGYIETYPLISKQWFEFWRNDVVDVKSLSHSSLNSVRRIATLKISQTETQKQINCEVIVQQLSYDAQRSSGQLRVAKLSNENEAEMQAKPIYQWYQTGTDLSLANAILKSIEKKL